MVIRLIALVASSHHLISLPLPLYVCICKTDMNPLLNGRPVIRHFEHGGTVDVLHLCYSQIEIKDFCTSGTRLSLPVAQLPVLIACM